MSDQEISLAGQFHIKEFEALRSEINRRSDEQFSTIRGVAIGAGTIYSIAGTLNKANIPENIISLTPLLWFLTPLLVILGFLNWWGNHFAIMNIASYIEVLEAKFDPKEKGWQCYAREKDPKIARRGKYIIWMQFASWAIIILFTLTVPIFLLNGD